MNQGGSAYLGNYCQLPEPIITCRRDSVSIGIELELETEREPIVFFGDYRVTSGLVEPRHDPGKPIEFKNIQRLPSLLLLLNI